MNGLDWNHLPTSSRLALTELKNQEPLKAFDYTEESIKTVLIESVTFYNTSLLIERSSGQSKLQDSDFSRTRLWIQSFSVAGVKKCHTDASIRISVWISTSALKNFPSLMGLDRHSKCHSYSLHTLGTSSNIFSMPLPLHWPSNSTLNVSWSFSSPLTVLSIFLVLKNMDPFRLHPQTLTRFLSCASQTARTKVELHH